MKILSIKYALVFIGLIIIAGCSNEEKASTTTPPTTGVPAVYNKIYGATSITNDGTFITIKTNGVPDHKSVYYPTNNPLYEAYSGTTFGGKTFVKNQYIIASQTFTFKIPLNPIEHTNHTANHGATDYGAIGVAINGVALYNQDTGPNNEVITTDIASFDKYYGHSTATSQYHYHVEPLYLTTVKSSKSGLMGFLLDGFPVYGPQEENGTTVTTAGLDEYHGHTHATVDFPNGIYHYHFTSDAPYLNSNGYYGTAGTVTQ